MSTTLALLLVAAVHRPSLTHTDLPPKCVARCMNGPLEMNAIVLASDNEKASFLNNKSTKTPTCFASIIVYFVSGTRHVAPESCPPLLWSFLHRPDVFHHQRPYLAYTH